jgi:two-component system, OmpR family, phosphate regulon sensor histidine kinase PhoR
MRRLLRVRPLVFSTIAAVVAGTLIVDAYTPSLVATVLVALALSILATMLIGALLVRPLARLRRETLARSDAETSPLPGSPIAEVSDVAAAIDRVARERRELLQRLTMERDALAVLVGSVSEGILHVSSAGRIVHANPAARMLLGLPASVSGQPVATLVRNAELRALLESAVESGTLGTCEVSVDERRLLVAARPVAGTNGGAPGGVVVALADLTEVRRLEGVRRDFVANVSHELKTPLTSIRGYVETLLAEPLPEDMQRQFLEVVRKNAERLHRIVDDLLDLSRVESGGWCPDLQSVDAAELAHDVWHAFRERAERKRITFDVSGGAVRVLADPDGLRQVLSNVFDNALRYTGEGGAIEVAAARIGDVATIDVRDTGTGIPSDALPRIFERFYRVDPARSRAEGGTGLGLSIVKHLVDRMGGDVLADSELGRGTTIRLRLPVAP